MRSGLAGRHGTVGAYLAVSFEAFLATLVYSHDHRQKHAGYASFAVASDSGWCWRPCTALLGKAKLMSERLDSHIGVRCGVINIVLYLVLVDCVLREVR